MSSNLTAVEYVRPTESTNILVGRTTPVSHYEGSEAQFRNEVNTMEANQACVKMTKSRLACMRNSASWVLRNGMKRKEIDVNIDGAASDQTLAFMSNDNKRKYRPVQKTNACYNCDKQEQ